jgi:hypothetical protein
LKNYLGSVGKITPIGSQEKITTNLLVWLNDKSWSEIKPLLHVGANDVLTNTARRFSPVGLCVDQQGVRPEKWDRFSNKYARPVISNGKQTILRARSLAGDLSSHALPKAPTQNKQLCAWPSVPQRDGGSSSE